MKKWIDRLLGGGKETSAPEADQAGQDAEERDFTGEVDATWYRWLTASSGYQASDELQERILDAVRALVHDPAGAAELVPRMPELIPQLMRSLAEEDMSAGDLSRQVAQDKVLVAEVIRESNSAYYRPLTPIETLEAAVMMLGHNGLRMLLARVALRPLIKMQGAGFARQAAPQVWNQSEKSAFAASLMAPGLSAGVFEAYLAGLMQNIGLVVAFRVADGLVEGNRMPGSSAFGLRLMGVSRQLSAVIARHWDFPPEVADAIHDPGADTGLAQALALGDRIAKLRVLIDGRVLVDTDPLVTEGLNGFQRRCLGKLADIES